MYTLSVTINDGATVVAGGAGMQTVNALVTCRFAPDADPAVQQITLTVGGSTPPTPGLDAQHVRWFEERILQPGDTVRIALRDDAVPSVPGVQLPVASPEDHERRIFENCKRAYFALRAQYETPPQDAP